MLPLPRNIILVGFMASGKSVVGEVLSRLTGMPLLDTDDEIVLRAGKPINQIFQESGEAAFRELERAVIADLCSRSGNVIAAGGGAFVDPGNRTLMLASGLVFCLGAQPETILRRVTEPTSVPPSSRQGREGLSSSQKADEQGNRGGAHNPVRPLLTGGDPMGRIKSLLAQRADAYAQAHHTIETDQLTPEQVAGRILGLCSTRTAVNGE
jgi:shikimate kinase